MLKRSFFALGLASLANASDEPPNANGVYECLPNMACWPLVNTAYMLAQMQQQQGRSSASNNQKTIVDFRSVVIEPAVADEKEESAEAALASQPNPRFGAKIPIQLVANYGCWCYGGSQWPTGEGRSTPRDLHDDACKAHSMGMKCIITDAKYENKQCEPYTTDYDVTITQDGYGKLLMECSDSIEDDWCRRRVCMVELRLLARYWKLMDMGVWPEYHKWAHPNINGPFDPMVNCEPKPGKEPIELRCCGDYPYRSWYYAHVADNSAGRTQCCVYQNDEINEAYGFPINVGKIYNQFSETCTAEGVV